MIAGRDGMRGFVLVRRLLRLTGLGPAPDARDVEIAVLRRQLMVLRRQVGRPQFSPLDRIMVATLAGCCHASGGRPS